MMEGPTTVISCGVQRRPLHAIVRRHKQLDYQARHTAAISPPFLAPDIS